MFSLVLVMVWKSVGYYVLLIMAALQTVPSNIYEAAELDSTPKWESVFQDHSSNDLTDHPVYLCCGIHCIFQDL